MKSLIQLSLVLLIVLTTSCGSTNSTRSTYQDPHSKMHSQMHNELYQEEVQKALENQVKNVLGNYAGIAPCPDCAGIEMQLELLPDLSYKSTVVYRGKPNPPLEKTGVYKFDNKGVVQLTPPSGNVSFLAKTANGLVILDKEGNHIKSAGGEIYILNQISIKSERTFDSKDPKTIDLKKKWDAGIRFYATGNTEDWSLTMLSTDSLHLKLANELVYSGPAPAPLASMEPGITNYRVKLEKGEIMIQMTENSCASEDLKNPYSYAVKVAYKVDKNEDRKTLEGCGNFIPDPWLSRRWKILKVNDTDINITDPNGKAPQLNLDLINDVFSGNDGCNSIRGNVKYRYNNLNFGISAGTLMACPEMEISDMINKAIAEKVLKYELGEYLILYEGKKQVLVLEHLE